MYDISDVQQALKDTRIKSGLTQVDVAKRAGTSQSAIASLERGDTNPTVDTLVRYAAALGVSLQVLLKPLPMQDQVIERYKRDVDRTLLRENLRKSVDERLRSLGDWQEDARKLQRATAQAKARRGQGGGTIPLTQLEILLAALGDRDVEFIIMGGVAARAHGSARVTDDLDISYSRSPANLDRLVTALAPLNPYLRGAPEGLPFDWSVATLRAGLNFPLTTTAGPIDLLGEITGGGRYDDLLPHTLKITVFGRVARLLDLPWLIRVKRAAGRPKDFEVIAELEAIEEEMRLLRE